MAKLWKLVGLAGAVGVAAGGVLIARDERRRKSYTVEEIRDRLHQRVDESSGPTGQPS